MGLLLVGAGAQRSPRQLRVLGPQLVDVHRGEGRRAASRRDRHQVPLGLALACLGLGLARLGLRLARGPGPRGRDRGGLPGRQVCARTV